MGVYTKSGEWNHCCGGTDFQTGRCGSIWQYGEFQGCFLSDYGDQTVNTDRGGTCGVVQCGGGGF